MLRRAGPALVAIAAFLALADTGVVALALPPILLELDTTVSGAAAVLGVYAVVLAAALPLAVRLARVRPVLTGVGGMALFGAASLGCGLADSLPLLLALRGVQAVGGAAVLVAAFPLLAGGAAPEPGGHLWRIVALLGTAAGPALGGALTQAFGWRSIFLVQAGMAPLLIAGFAAERGELERRLPAPLAAGASRGPAAAALVLVSGALAAALFLTVLLLVNGWSIEPLAAAAAVSVLPLFALLGAQVPGSPAPRAAAGSLLLAAGTACLAFLPTASVAWTIVPQALAGLGMGLALTALAGPLLPQRDTREAAHLLALRHVGIALALVLLAPVLTDRLEAAVEDAKREGAALILDASIAPQDKLEVAPELAGAVRSDDPRDDLRREFDDYRPEIDEEELAAFDELEDRADETLVGGVNEGFALAFLIGGGFALIAAVLLWRGRSVRIGIAAVALTIALPAVFALAAEPSRPPPVELADPCEERELPETGGISGLAQDAALVALDRAACDAGSSREELVLALVDDDEAERYERTYGVDPRSILDLIGAALGID
jgi:Major Facilitator Superfamily